MNTRQIASLQTLTNRINRSAKMAISGEWMNGPVCFKVEEMSDGAIMLSAVNVDHAWFETHCHALFFIGIRGGIKLSHCEGFHRRSII